MLDVARQMVVGKAVRNALLKREPHEREINEKKQESISNCCNLSSSSCSYSI